MKRITQKQIEKAALNAFEQVLEMQHAEVRGRTRIFLYPLVFNAFVLGIEWYNNLLIQEEQKNVGKKPC